MACYHPLIAVPILDENGKNVLHFKSIKKYGSIEAIQQRWQGTLLIPCGRCIGCRLAYSREWAIRSVLELSYHKKASFITLTYNDDNLPAFSTLDFDRVIDPETGVVSGVVNDVTINPVIKKDFQDFMKRLRRYFSYNYGCNDIRFIGCGEYGDLSGRPHYHAILFGVDFDDKKLFTISHGEKYYISETLSKLWPKGNVIIGDVTFQSCAYVARYVLKKRIGLNNHGIKPNQFMLSSRRPGLGRQYFNDNWQDIYNLDLIQFDFGKFDKAKPPKYFDYLAKQLIFDYDRIGEKRADSALRSIDNQKFIKSVNTIEELNYLNETALADKIKILKKGAKI